MNKTQQLFQQAFVRHFCDVRLFAGPLKGLPSETVIIDTNDKTCLAQAMIFVMKVMQDKLSTLEAVKEVSALNVPLTNEALVAATLNRTGLMFLSSTTSSSLGWALGSPSLLDYGRAGKLWQSPIYTDAGYTEDGPLENRYYTLTRSLYKTYTLGRLHLEWSSGDPTKDHVALSVAFLPTSGLSCVQLTGFPTLKDLVTDLETRDPTFKASLLQQQAALETEHEHGPNCSH